MLSLQSWWLVTTPTDLRCGMDRLLLQVRTVLGRDPAEGEAYVFGNRSGSRIKLLCCDRHGVWLAAIQAQSEDAATSQTRRKAASAGRKPLPEHLERIQLGMSRRAAAARSVRARWCRSVNT